MLHHFALNFIVALVVFSWGFLVGRLAAELVPAIATERNQH